MLIFYNAVGMHGQKKVENPCARKSIKGSKVVDFCSFQKNWAKNGSLDGRPGSGKGGQKKQKHPLVTSICDIPHREPQTQNEKSFFSK